MAADAPITNPMIDVAEAVSDMFGDIGYAFVEDDRLEALADTLRAFMKTAGIPTDESSAAAFFRAAAIYQEKLPTGITDLE